MDHDKKAIVDNFVLQAVQLHNRVNELASGYSVELSPSEQFKRWTFIVSALNGFMRETSGRAEAMAAVTGLTALLENIATGKPSLADNYKKGGSQQQGIETQSAIAFSCAALDFMERAGFEPEEAARRVVSLMHKHGVPRAKGSVEWKALQKRRDKLRYNEIKDQAICELYQSFTKDVDSIPPAECEAEAARILEALGELKGG